LNNPQLKGQGVGIAPVSVIIPCYRCSRTLGRALASVFAQKLVPAEIVLVDDFSEDGTLELMVEFEQRYPAQLKILPLMRNLGAGSARNAGWNVATQPYIAFLDADDSWHHSKLSEQYAYMENHPEVVLCGHKCALMSIDYPPAAFTAEIKADRISFYSLLFRSAFSTPTVMLRRDIPFRFQAEKRSAEDLFLWQQIAYAGLPVTRLDATLAYVHKPLYGAGGLSSQLWNMERGELANFWALYRAGNIGFLLCAVTILFSFLKFLRRAVVVQIRRWVSGPVKA